LEVVGNIKVINRILIKARERRIIQARVSNGKILEGREGYIEPCIACNDIIDGLQVANSLSRVRNGTIIIEILNLNREDTWIERTTKLGTFTQLGEINCIAEVPANNARQTLNTDVGDLFDLTNSDLNKDQIVLVKQMLRRHHNAIAKNRDDLGLTSSAEHVINV
jgi:hypothetical protein